MVVDWSALPKYHKYIINIMFPSASDILKEIVKTMGQTYCQCAVWQENWEPAWLWHYEWQTIFGWHGYFFCYRRLHRNAMSVSSRMFMFSDDGFIVMPCQIFRECLCFPMTVGLHGIYIGFIAVTWCKTKYFFFEFRKFSINRIL